MANPNDLEYYSTTVPHLNITDIDGTNGFKINGIDAYDFSGTSVSSAGDVNGDGIDDIIIGAQFADSGGNPSVGESYVVFGSGTRSTAALNLSSLDGTNGFKINGIDGGDSSGASVSSAGDVNGDGIDDIILGATYADPGGNEGAGESYVVFGSDTRSTAALNLSSLDGTNGFKINGIDAYDFSGTSVSSAGDVNGDGIDDIIIGAFGADPGGNEFAGESYVVFGSDTRSTAALNLSSLDGTNGFKINGIDAYDKSGFSVSSAGDVNGDGIDDIIIGADDADPDGNENAGESYVVFGSDARSSAALNLSSLDGTNGFKINGIDAYDFSGTSVSSAGDVNGDGIADIIIGAFGADPGGNEFAGESYVVFGSDTRSTAALNLSSLDGTNGFKINGIDGGDRSGVSVSSAGDVNRDGIDDIIIGPFGTDSGFAYTGKSYVVFGSDTRSSAALNLSSLDGTNGFKINGIDAYDSSEWSPSGVTEFVSSAGDVNGDGIDDLVIGASSTNQSYVVFGEKTNLFPTGAVTITGTATEDEALTAVTSTLSDEDGLGELSYQWKADGVNIAGATSNTLTLGQSEVGTAITVAVSYTDDGGTAEKVTSSATSAVTNVNDDPTGSVGITGTAAEDETLSAVTSTLADEDGLGVLRYQWKADGVDISGATAETLALSQDEVGKEIAVAVSYTDGGGTDETVTSDPTAFITELTTSDAAFDIELASTSGSVATFEVYATEAADSGDPGLDDVDFVLSHSLVDMTIDEATIDLADGFGFGIPNYEETTGELNVAAIAIPPVTDLTAPILTFNATILNDDTPFNITIDEVLVDDTSQPSVTEEFDFTSVEVESTVVGRGGQALSDVRVSYDFVTPSGQEQSIELPMQAASNVSQAMERGSDMTVTADRSIDEKSADAITANDALQALRLAVGLDKSDGAAEWHDYIAADINKDGQVSANDALNILKLAVGLDDADPADWVFVDSNADYSDVDRKNTTYDEGVSLENVVTDTSVDMTGILVGDVNGSYVTETPTTNQGFEVLLEGSNITFTNTGPGLVYLSQITDSSAEFTTMKNGFFESDSITGLSSGISKKTIVVDDRQAVEFTAKQLLDDYVEGVQFSGAGDIEIEASAETLQTGEAILVLADLQGGNLEFDLPFDDDTVLKLAEPSLIDLGGGDLVVEDGTLDASNAEILNAQMVVF